MDVPQALEELIEELVAVQKEVRKLKTQSVSGQALRTRIKDANKVWLPILGALQSGGATDLAKLQEVAEAWKKLAKLAGSASPKAQYQTLFKSILATCETEILHELIKGSAIQTVGSNLRKLVHQISDPKLLTYLDESIRCAEQACIRASAVLAWCAVAYKIHTKLTSLGIPTLNTEFAKMKADRGLMFRQFNKDYVFSTEHDVQEAADAHLILLCRFLTFLDDTQYKHLRGALDLRNGCGHPTGYLPDAIKLQAYYADITQLVLLNPKFA